MADLTVSSAVDTLMQAADAAGLRTAIGAITNIGAATATSIAASGALSAGTTVTDKSGIIGRRVADLITQATHGFVAGDWVYNANSVWTKTTSAAAASSSGAVFVESAPTVNTFVAIFAGPADITGLGFSAGTRRYLTTTAGGTATTPTAGAANFSSPVMVVASATVGYVIPLVALPQALVNLTSDVTNILPTLNGGTQAATPYGGFDNLTAHGADVASATTTNLSTSTGYLVDVTGTTTITAITLNEGQFRVVRFTGALILTNGSSLLLPGGANITTVAGDIAIFVGYAGSVVRCVSYSPITVTGTGAAVKATSPTLVTPALGTPSALVLTNATALPAAQVVAGAMANGMTATTQSAGSADTKVATDAYADTAAKAAALGSYGTPDTTAGALAWTAPLYEVFTNTTTTYALPAAAGYAGRGIILYVVGTNLITIDPNASEVIVRDGTAQTGGVTMTLTGVAGNYVCMMCDGTRWVTLGFKGTLAAGS